MLWPPKRLEGKRLRADGLWQARPPSSSSGWELMTDRGLPRLRALYREPTFRWRELSLPMVARALAYSAMVFGTAQLRTNWPSLRHAIRPASFKTFRW